MAKHLKVIGKRFRGKDGTIVEWSEHPDLIEISATNPKVKGIAVHYSFSHNNRLMAQVVLDELVDKFDVKMAKRR